MANDLDSPPDELVAVSRHYGGDPAFVLAGGGNTSLKTRDALWVKASGHAMATIDAGGFVALDRSKLDAMLAGDWPSDPREREARFIERVLDARLQPERGQRPSVEALLHHLLPDRLVVHTHPGLVNALTCCVEGERITRELFGDDVLWQPYVDPGLTLAKSLRESLASRVGRPRAVFLENHGLIVSGESTDAIAATSDRLIRAIADRLGPLPTVGEGDATRLADFAAAIATFRPALHVAADSTADACWLAGTNGGRAAAAAGPLTPDQVVYCRSFPLFVREPSDVANAWDEYVRRYRVEPWVAVVEGAGVIAVRESAKLAETTRAVYVDAAAVSRRAALLGGVRALSVAHRTFIEAWEVEAYRRSVAAVETSGGSR